MRLLVTGASGQLGGYLLRESAVAGLDMTAWCHSHPGEVAGVTLRPVDLADGGAVASAFREARPDAVIHAAAVSSIAACHRNPGRAERVNVGGTALLAELAAAAGARLVLVSTDLVFDGERGGYREEDAPAPLSVYGRTKVAAEGAALACPRAAAVRCSLLF